MELSSECAEHPDAKLGIRQSEQQYRKFVGMYLSFLHVAWIGTTELPEEHTHWNAACLVPLEGEPPCETKKP